MYATASPIHGFFGGIYQVRSAFIRTYTHTYSVCVLIGVLVANNMPAFVCLFVLFVCLFVCLLQGCVQTAGNGITNQRAGQLPFAFMQNSLVHFLSSFLKKSRIEKVYFFSPALSYHERQPRTISSHLVSLSAVTIQMNFFPLVSLSLRPQLFPLFSHCWHRTLNNAFPRFPALYPLYLLIGNTLRDFLYQTFLFCDDECKY